jgi:hypothetical protein
METLPAADKKALDAALETIASRVFTSGQAREMFDKLRKACPNALTLKALQGVTRNPSPLLTRMRQRLETFTRGEEVRELDYHIAIEQREPRLSWKESPEKAARQRTGLVAAFWTPLCASLGEGFDHAYGSTVLPSA